MRDSMTGLSDRLSLRAPQREALERLAALARLFPLRRSARAGLDAGTILARIRAACPDVEAFERDFPSLCFALATGVGKTRLMGAFIGHLHAVHGVRNFFVLAPNLTIHDKLIADFTPNTPKYVLRGLSEFAVVPPVVVTGQNYERLAHVGGRPAPVAINIFNISKMNAELRGGERKLRMRSFREEIGASYFDHLAGLDDLVLIMDESHRYRASAAVRALNELNPVLGLELTATPFVETAKGAVPFRNVVYSYPLARAIDDGFVKEPAVVTRADFSAAGLSEDRLERVKLEDGIRLHEQVKAELAAYAVSSGERLVKPFMLVIARNTAHAAELVTRLQSPDFADGAYAGKVIQVDSSVREDETITRLLHVERADEETEVVVHVNMLKEGWDVNNLYTIVPLRAANARTLIEQSIGRGLRLPFGRRTGVAALDRLSIVAHDRFQDILEEARRPDSVLNLAAVILPGTDARGLATVVSRPLLESRLEEDAGRAGADAAHAAWQAIQDLQRAPALLPHLDILGDADIRAGLVRAVSHACPAEKDAPAVVDKVAALVAQGMIAIPRVMTVPVGDDRRGLFGLVQLDLSGLDLGAPSETLWVAHLNSGAVERVEAGGRLSPADGSVEDVVLMALSALEEVAYELNTEALRDMAAQVARHLMARMSEAEARRAALLHGERIARFVRTQMPWTDPAAVEVRTVVTRGFTLLKPMAYTLPAGGMPLDFRRPAPAAISGSVFGGFTRCLYPLQKFDSDPERVLAVVLDRDADKWFRPARGQFGIFYRLRGAMQEYQPDFVAETADGLLMLEVKAADRLADEEVVAKREAAVRWCAAVNGQLLPLGAKPWRYVLIPHDRVAENMSLPALSNRFGFECA